MKPTELIRWHTLQGRLVIFLIIPVFCMIFLWGVVSFLYTRDVMVQQWNESAVLKLQRAAHFIEMRLMRPVELVELMYRSIPGGQSPILNEIVADALKDMEGVVKVDFTYAGPNRILPRKQAMGMSWQRMMFYQHTRIMEISSPAYDVQAGDRRFKMTLNLLDAKQELVGTIEILMRFAYVVKDLHLNSREWLETGMACIVDENLRYLFHTDMKMQGQRSLGDSDDPLALAVMKKMASHSHATVVGKGHPPERIAGFYKLDNVPWTIIIYARGDKLLRPIIRFRNVFAISGVLLIGVVIFLIRFHVLKIASRIRLLSLRAAGVARGEYKKPISSDSRDEMGILVDSFNAMVEGLKERDFIRNSFGLYVDPDVARKLLKRPDAGNLGGKRKEVVIMMTDIRGFTRMAEQLSPETTIEILNKYFSYMIDVIQSHNGIIVDFFGDGILVFFEPHDSPLKTTLENALQCAGEMQKEMTCYNQGIESKDIPEMQMGIGVHTGPVIVGNMGSETRKKYGVVGAAVNLTSRIQATARGGEIVVSHAVYSHFEESLTVKRSFEVRLKGVDRPLRLYAIIATDGPGFRPCSGHNKI